MSLFTESSWEVNTVGDKLSKEIFHKKKNKGKKNGKSPTVVSKKISKKASKTQETSRQNLPANHETKKAKKRQRAISGADQSEETLSKKAKHTSGFDKQENSKKKFKQVGKDSNKETKSQRKRKKLKMKRAAANPRVGLSNDRKISPPATEKKSPVIKNLNVKRLESMLATKEKTKRSQTPKTPESLRDRMMSQLRASRFRFLNETLYNNESSESKKFFKEDPDAFAAYHAGYKQQVDQWPLNPLDNIITWINKLPKDYVVADFGCGEARLAESVTQRVHSFDLVAVNERVKACDMAHTPLLTSGVNIAVFCLSLMGTNLGDYLLEANRVLKMGGIMKIADVESRFDNVDEFITSLKSYGFIITWKDLSHNLFYFMDFKKVSDVNRNAKKLPPIALKACLYKKR